MKPDTAPLFVGCATALVTPMLPAPAGDGYTPPPVDYEAFVRLVRRQIAAGVDALVVCGTTGESSTLTGEEKLQLFSLAVQEPSGGGGGHRAAAYSRDRRDGKQQHRARRDAVPAGGESRL